MLLQNSTSIITLALRNTEKLKKLEKEDHIIALILSIKALKYSWLSMQHRLMLMQLRCNNAVFQLLSKETDIVLHCGLT